MVIGITGNSGSGKSTVSKALAKKINAKIIDADEIAKELAKPGHIYFKKIVELFGDKILEDNQINRKKLADIIYNDKISKQKLDKLTYQYVTEEIKQRICGNSIIIDAPLLFESELNSICDATIAILSEENIKIKRICARDNIDIKTAKKRLDIQSKDEFYIKKADYIVKNNGNLDEINLEDICIKIGKK